MSVGTELHERALEVVHATAGEAKNEALDQVDGAIMHYKKRLLLVVKTYPVCVAVVAFVFYGLGSGANWVKALF